MSKLKVVYDCEEEVEDIIKNVEKYIDMKHDNINIKQQLQFILQKCFDEGRKFQKLSTSLNRDFSLDI